MKFETLMKTAQKATQKTAKKPQRETPYYINNASLADMYTTTHTTVPSLPPSPKNNTGRPIIIMGAIAADPANARKSVGTAGTKGQVGVRSHTGFHSPNFGTCCTVGDFPCLSSTSTLSAFCRSDSVHSYVISLHITITV
jgi:hypothetical protein